MKSVQRLCLVFMLTLLVWSCGSSKSNETSEEVVEESVPPSLTFLWETSDKLITNESVLVDENSGTIYVANIEGIPTEKDGKGSISIINKSGEILIQEWVSGIDAPKGMGISNGKLYVTNIDELVEIDIKTAQISNRISVAGAEFLNDVDTDGDKVYFSDMKKGKIYLYENGKVNVFTEGQENINGLRVGNGGTLYGLDAAGLKKYHPDGSFQIINSVVTGGDGLIVLDENTFLASRWLGEIYIIKNGQETKLLDTTEAGSNTADIGYMSEENIVFVPTFFKNKVVAYKLTY